MTAEYVPQATDDAEAIQLVKHEHIDEALLDNQALSENKGGGGEIEEKYVLSHPSTLTPTTQDVYGM